VTVKPRWATVAKRVEGKGTYTRLNKEKVAPYCVDGIPPGWVWNFEDLEGNKFTYEQVFDQMYKKLTNATNNKSVYQAYVERRNRELETKVAEGEIPEPPEDDDAPQGNHVMCSEIENDKEQNVLRVELRGRKRIVFEEKLPPLSKEEEDEVPLKMKGQMLKSGIRLIAGMFEEQAEETFASKTHYDLAAPTILVEPIKKSLVPDFVINRSFYPHLKQNPWMESFKSHATTMVAQMQAAFTQVAEWIKSLPEKREALLKEHPWLSHFERVVAVLGLVGAGYSIYTYLNGESTPNLIAHAANPSGDEKTRAVKYHKYKYSGRGPNQKIERVKLSNMHSQMLDKNAVDLIESRIKDNVIRLKWMRQDGSVFGKVYCTMLYKKAGITVLHMLNAKPTCCDWLLVETSRGTFKVRHTEPIVEIIGKDLAIIDFSDCPTFPEFKDLRHHIIDECMLSGDLSQVGLVKTTEKGTYVWVGKAHVKRTAVDYSLPGDQGIATLDGSLWTQLPTEDGDCASPYLVFNPSIGQKILAFHVAGDNYNGLGEIFTRQMLAGTCLAFHAQMGSEPRITCTENVEFVRYVAEAEVPRLPNKSEIHPSPLQAAIKKKVVDGFEPPKTAPAHLRPFFNDAGERISPAQNGLKKYPVDEPDLTEEDIKLLEECADTYAKRIPYSITPRRLTLDEAINGVKGWNHSSGMQMKKSPGYRHTTLEKRVVPGKRGFFTCKKCKSDKNCDCQAEAGFDPKPEIADTVYYMIRKYQIGEAKDVEVIWMDCLKDERRKHAKNLAGDTRVFSAAEMEHFLVRRMFYQAFVENFMMNPLQVCSALGINPHSPQWKMLLEHITRNGTLDKNGPGDYEKYDGSIKRILCNLACRIMDDWYMKHPDYVPTEQEKEIREALKDKTYHGLHILLDLIYRPPYGANPSGDLLTTIFNIIVNVIAHMWCAVKEAREKGIQGANGLYSPKDYFHDFGLTCLGDDHNECWKNDWHKMSDSQLRC